MTEALKPSEVLAKAADLIEPEGAWTQDEMARDADGQDVSPVSPRASCWCAVGAIQRFADEGSPIYPLTRSFLVFATGHGLVATWNDRPYRTQPEVVAALRKASELARSEGQ